MSRVWILINIFLRLACHPHLLLPLNRKHEICQSSYRLAYLQSPHMILSSEIREGGGAVRERNSLIPAVAFGIQKSALD